MKIRWFLMFTSMISAGVISGQIADRQTTQRIKKTEILCDTTKSDLILMVKDGNYFIVDTETKAVKDLQTEPILIITKIDKEKDAKGFSRFVDRLPVCKDRVKSVLYVVTKKTGK